MSHELRSLVRVVGTGAVAFGIVVLALTQLLAPNRQVEPSNVVPRPDASRLTQATWHWQRTERGDGTTVVSSNPSKFTLTFGTDGRFSLKTDCNSSGGQYVVSGSRLMIEKAMMTMMACPMAPRPPQEWVFYGHVTDTSTFAFEGEQLILYLKDDGGHVVLTPQPA